MPIFHGDFFDETDWKPVAFHGGKVPFEDSVLLYIKTHPDDTYEGCAKNMGICLAAVYMAIDNLVAKGLVARD